MLRNQRSSYRDERSRWPKCPLVIADPATRTDALGEYPGGGAVVCQGDVIVCLDDSWDYAYSVSHEIAERLHGFTHEAKTAWDQCNLLARWHRLRTEPEG